jgi:ribonuclease P protein component
MLPQSDYKVIMRHFTKACPEPKLSFLLTLRLKNGTFTKLVKLVISTKLRDSTVRELISRALAQRLSHHCVLLSRLDMVLSASTSLTTELILSVWDLVGVQRGLQSLRRYIESVGRSWNSFCIAAMA